MLQKDLYYEYGDNDSEVLSLLSDNLVKTAGYSDDVSEYVDNLKVNKGKTYALVNALSAGEFYGSNRNGDYFPEKALKEYHKTFEALGHVYKHHVNKDPRKSMGRVKFASYNNKMHRVELVLELDNVKSAAVITNLRDGKLPAVSMGCRVPWDECSICHQRATKTANYCTHLKSEMNSVKDNGERVYAINTMPKFFDLSVVTIPADRTAGFIRHLDEDENKAVTSAKEESKESTWFNSLQKQASLQSEADIKKKIDAKVDAISKDPKKLILKSQKKLSKETIEKLSEYPLNEVLSTFLALRIVPLREDFQKLALYSLNKKDEADKYEKEGICFEVGSNTTPEVPNDVSLNCFNEKIAGLLMEDVIEMALTKPLIIARQLAKSAQISGAETGTYFDPHAEARDQENAFPGRQKKERSFISQTFFGMNEEPKLSPVKDPIVPLGILGSLYYGYIKTFNDVSTTGFRRFMSKHPWLLAMLVGSGSAASVIAQKGRFGREDFGKNDAPSPFSLEKEGSGGGDQVYRFLRNSLVTVPVSYYNAGSAQAKAQKGIPITKTEDFVRRHPILVALSASLLGASAQRAFRTTAKATSDLASKKWKSLWKISSVVTRMKPTFQDQLYNELIQN